LEETMLAQRQQLGLQSGVRAAVNAATSGQLSPEFAVQPHG